MMEQPRVARSRAMARPMPFVAPLGVGQKFDCVMGGVGMVRGDLIGDM